MRSRGAGSSPSAAGLPGYEANLTINNHGGSPAFGTETIEDAVAFSGYFPGFGAFVIETPGIYLVSAFAEWQESGGNPAAGTVMSIQNTVSYLGGGNGAHSDVLMLGPMFDDATIDWAGSGLRFWHPQSVTLINLTSGTEPCRVSTRGSSTHASTQTGSLIVTMWKLNATTFPDHL